MDQLNSENIRAWEQRVLIPILRGETPSNGKEFLGGVALLSADTDKIKEYVFESAKLPEVRGASMILDELNQGGLYDRAANIRKLFARKGFSVDSENQDSCIIYAGGGSLLALVPADAAKELSQEIESLYPDQTGAATITCALQQVNDLAMLKDDFLRLMQAQTMLLRRRKEERASAPFFEALPHQRRCESCGARPATTLRIHPDERWLCAVCDTKRQRSMEKEGKREWTRRFEHWLRDAPSDIVKRYRGAAGDEALSSPHDVGRDIKTARDISEIAQAGRDKNLIGFIYADGDGVGRFIEEQASIREYRQNSQKLLEILPALVYPALARHLQVCCVRRDDDEVHIHPFEILTIGGDDLLLIVPGDAALPLALEICQGFGKAAVDQGLKSRDGRALSMSAGIVIAHHHNPVRYVRDLAEQLLKSAKKRARQSPEGAIDFLVLKSQSMLWSELKALRSQVYEWGYPARKPSEYIGLTGRPYSLSDMERLLDHARLLRDKDFPRSQVQGIRQALRQAQRLGRTWPTLWYVAQETRLRRWTCIMRYIDREWEMLDAPWGKLPPWRQIPEGKHGKPYLATVWEDLHEAREVLPRREKEPPAVQRRADEILSQIQRCEKEEDAYAS